MRLHATKVSAQQKKWPPAIGKGVQELEKRLNQKELT
jgi:hypothetical protein